MLKLEQQKYILSTYTMICSDFVVTARRVMIVIAYHIQQDLNFKMY